MGKIPKSNKHWSFNKTVAPEKKYPKLIKAGHTFILDYRVLECKRPQLIHMILATVQIYFYRTRCCPNAPSA